jgi:hypothetical protein
MKTTTSLSILTAAALLTGCQSTLPSVGALGAGSDSGYINASRGRLDAQMSEAQAQQYQRQHKVVSGEIDLEAKKRQHTHDNIRNWLDTGRSFLNFGR